MQRTLGVRSIRFIVPAVVFILAFVSGSVFIATGQTQPHTYYACSNAVGDLKNLRVDVQPTCGNKETLVSWVSGEAPTWGDLDGIPPAFQDGAIAWDEVGDVPSGFSDGVDDGLTSVTWNDLQNVPDGFADGTDAVDGGIAAGLHCDRCVGLTDIERGTIYMEHMANNSVGSDHVADNILTADDLGQNSVGTSELADGSVSTNDLGNGAVTAGKQTANVLTANGGTTLLVNGGSPVPLIMQGSMGFTPEGASSELHAVMVTVEIDLRCPACGPGNTANVNVFVEDQAGTPIGDKVVVLNEANERASVTINRMLFMPGGTPSSFVVAGFSVTTGNTDVIVERANIIVVDLGRTP